MKRLYEEPVVHISIFDDADDILTDSTATNSVDMAEEEINEYSGGVSIYSVDAKVN